MPNYVDALLLNKLNNPPGDTVPVDQTLEYVSPAGIKGWKDENGLFFQEGQRIRIITADRILTKEDRNTIIRSSGTTDITITIPADVGDPKLDLPEGSIIKIFRTDVGKVSVDLTNVTVIGPAAPRPWDLRLGEWVALEKVNGSFYRLYPDPNKVFTVENYFPRATWAIAIGVALNTIAVPTTAWSGEIAVGLETETSGGIFATAAAALTILADPFGSPLNIVEIRATDGNPLNDGANHIVWGFLRTTAADGDTNSGTNLTIDFAYIDPLTGNPIATNVGQNIIMGIPIAIAAEDMPLTI